MMISNLDIDSPLAAIAANGDNRNRHDRTPSVRGECPRGFCGIRGHDLTGDKYGVEPQDADSISNLTAEGTISVTGSKAPRRERALRLRVSLLSAEFGVPNPICMTTDLVIPGLRGKQPRATEGS
jgi:hypothetical protein